MADIINLSHKIFISRSFSPCLSTWFLLQCFIACFSTACLMVESLTCRLETNREFLGSQIHIDITYTIGLLTALSTALAQAAQVMPSILRV